MIFLDSVLGEILSRGKSLRKKRKASRKQAKRFTFENLEARTMFSATAPVAPSFAAAAVSSTEVDLAWIKVPAATGYVVDELMSNGSWKQIAKLGSSTTSDAVTKLSPDTSCEFEVGAYNSNGTSLAAAQTVVTFPAAPKFQATTASNTEIDLTWNVVTGASGYLVEEKINGQWVQIAPVETGTTGSSGTSITPDFIAITNPLDGSATSFAVTGLKPNTSYDFKVAAYGGTTADVSWASSQRATTLSKSSPTSFTATAVDSYDVALSWSTVSGAKSYQVAEMINGAWSTINNLANYVSSYTVTGLTAGATYEFRVGAVYSNVISWTSAQNATLPYPTPSLTITSVSNSQVNLAWSNLAPGASGVTIYQQTGSGSYVAVAYIGGSSTRTYAVSGLNAGTQYNFYVSVVYGAHSVNSPAAYSVTSTTSPTLSVYDVSSSEIDLFWNQVRGATSYTVYEWVNSAWTTIATTSATSPAYAARGLNSNTIYYFDVMANFQVGYADTNVVHGSTFLSGTTNGILFGSAPNTYYYLIGNNLYENTSDGNSGIASSVIEFGHASNGNLVYVTATQYQQTFLGIVLNSGYMYDVYEYENGNSKAVYAGGIEWGLSAWPSTSFISGLVGGYTPAS